MAYKQITSVKLAYFQAPREKLSHVRLQKRKHVCMLEVYQTELKRTKQVTP